MLYRYVSIVAGPLFFCASALATSSSEAPLQGVEVRENKLFVDGVSQPQLYGAELQYFRLRGGQGRNVPRTKVIELWARALDRMTEAGMNAISFYIPWDFHEYAEGKFDFTGTADEDGDGNADYPSRDLFTFFRMIEEHGIRRIMVRPGPYINAEWGFLGFGAIPLWFHEKYPNSHMRNPEGLRTKLYDYHSPELLEHTRLWFQRLHQDVLRHYLGAGKPILFLQLDNETNFMWQSIFGHDYSLSAVDRYQAFLKANYLELARLNQSYGKNWRSWDEIRPPGVPGLNVAEDRGWYRFQDESIHSYLEILRGFWEQLGVAEPTVLFTLAESYNALGNGLLPNFLLRNDPGKTGMMTLNLYPKTYETASMPLMNLPFKADHDVIAMDEASDHYLGSRQEWLLGPEIQGGWWKGIDVSSDSRQQTYLSALGHGLKALFIYYFTEGDNWQNGWAREQLSPIFEGLKSRPEYNGLPVASLPHEFWNELQSASDHQLLVGFDSRKIMTEDGHEAETLYFDAPLDAEARPRAQYALVKKFGTQVVRPNAEFLANATELSDAVTVVKDTGDHAPSVAAGVDALLMNAEWCGGLVGYLMQTGVNPRIFHWGMGNLERLSQSQVILRQDAGVSRPEAVRYYDHFIRSGGTLINFLDGSLARALGVGPISVSASQSHPVALISRISKGSFETAAKPIYFYEGIAQSQDCEEILSAGSRAIGYRCRLGKGVFVQVGGLFYDAFNSDYYAELTDVPARRDFLAQLLADAGVRPRIRIAGGGDRLVAFARKAANGKGLWLTVKNGQKNAIRASILIDPQLLTDSVGAGERIEARALVAGKRVSVTSEQLFRAGLEIELSGNGSDVYFLSTQALLGQPH